MKKTILFVLLLLFIPLAQAIPPVTSYWGYATFDGGLVPNAAITVFDSSGNQVASATSTQNATYAVDVYWDRLPSQVGQSLTFQVNGRTATTRPLVDSEKGLSIRLDLAASSSSGSSSSGGGGSSSSGGTYTSSTGTTQATSTAVQTATATPVATTTEVPTATTTAKPEVTETTKVPTPKPTTPGFGAITAIFAIAMLAFLLKNNISRR